MYTEKLSHGKDLGLIIYKSLQKREEGAYGVFFSQLTDVANVYIHREAVGQNESAACYTYIP